MKKIEETLVDLEEVRAYKELEGCPFNFGTGLIFDLSTESEAARYEMIEMNLEAIISDYELSQTDRTKRRKPENRKRWNLRKQNSHIRKQKDKERLKTMTFIRIDELGNWVEKKYYLNKKKRTAEKSKRKRLKRDISFSDFIGCDYIEALDHWWCEYQI